MPNDITTVIDHNDCSDYIVAHVSTFDTIIISGNIIEISPTFRSSVFIRAERSDQNVEDTTPGCRNGGLRTVSYVH
jgi:hypothetical protein